MERDGYIQIPENIEVNIHILTILLGVDRTLLKIAIDNGYQIKEVLLDDITHKDKVIMGDKSINHKYFLSKIEQNIDGQDKISFICIVKEDKLCFPHPDIKETITISDKPFFDAEKEVYKESQFKYINDFISKLMIHKEGDVGIYEVFFDYEWQIIIANFKNFDTILITDANGLCTNLYSISDDEVVEIDKFIRSHHQAFELLKSVVDSFTYSYKLLYDAKAFEQLVTVAEILFLPKNQTNKKETLSKRVAVFIGKDNAEILAIYNDMKSYYKYRSDSTHEGIDTNITKQALLYLREFTRKAIKKYMEIIDNELSVNPLINFQLIKSKVVSALVIEVAHKISSGVLPT